MNTTTDRMITVTLPAPSQVLADILTTACEGGSHYWLAAHRIERDSELNVLAVVKPLDNETRKRFDASNFSPGFEANRTRDITHDTIVVGIQQLLAGKLPKRWDVCAAVIKGLVNPEDLDVDSEGADIIVQLGFFGELVYG